MEQKDYYNTLGIEKKATKQQIKDAFRNLAFKYHPDRNKDNPMAAEKMKRINEAYAVLSNSNKRNEYDALRDQFGSSAYQHFRKNYQQEDIFRNSDINHIFEEISRQTGLRGFDELFKEFYGSGYKRFEFNGAKFSGRGFVYTHSFGRGNKRKVDSNTSGKLESFSRSFFKTLKGHKPPRRGSDIYDSIHIDQKHAQKGGPYAYLLRKKSKKLIIKIPPGIRHKGKIRLAGMGDDGKNGGNPGDLYLKVIIKKPLLKKTKDFIGSILTKK